MLLLGLDLAVWSASRRLLEGAFSLTVADFLDLLLIPLAQTAALAGFLAMRRRRG